MNQTHFSVLSLHNQTFADSNAFDSQINDTLKFIYTEIWSIRHMILTRIPKNRRYGSKGCAKQKGLNE